MKIPRFWARSSRPVGAKARLVTCCEWSDTSVEDARRRAEARAIELSAKFGDGVPLNRYLYGDRPLREEIVRTIKSAAGEETAIITRNVYGALVLNTRRAMFIDVDFGAADQRAQQGGLLRRLFGKSAPNDVEQRTLEKLMGWARQQPGLGVRVYRTFAGLRGLVTSTPLDPGRPETSALLRGTGNDPLYVRLCTAQESFRARLTPKPWRCGAQVPPVRYPWESGEQEARFRQWLAAYERAMAGFSVCRLVQQIGPAGVHPEIAPIVALHDQFTLTERSLA